MDLNFLLSIRNDLKYFLLNKDREDILKNIINDIDYIESDIKKDDDDDDDEIDDIPF